jgi:hypothetical protein
MDRLDGPTQLFFDPDQKRSTIMTVTPDKLQTGKQLFEGREQGTTSLVIGFLGSRHLHSQQVALRVGQCVTNASPHFFPRIVALFGTTHGAGFDRLTVDDGCTRLRISALLGAHPHAQGVQNAIPDSFPLPPAKVVIDGLPLRILMRQQAPGAPTPQHVQNRIDHLASLDKRPAALQGWVRDQRLQQVPLLESVKCFGSPALVVLT